MSALAGTLIALGVSSVALAVAQRLRARLFGPWVSVRCLDCINHPTGLCDDCALRFARLIAQDINVEVGPPPELPR